MSQLIRGKIAATRSRHSLVEACTGAAMALGALVGLITLGAISDWLFEFPWLLRAVLLAGYLGGVGYLVWARAIAPVIRAPDDEEIALRVEHLEPSFSSRLISAVQFSAPDAATEGASPAMIGAMMRETEEMAQSIDFGRIVQTRRLAQFAGATLVVLLLAGGLLAAGGGTAADLVARAFLSRTPLPTKTRVTSLSGSFTVARGDDAILKAKIQGWHPATGKAEIVYASGQKQALTLEPTADDPSVYAGTLSSVQDSFTYRLRVYDGHSDDDNVKATPRPTVVDVNCSVVYPAYTGLGTVAKPPGDLNVLAGSRLQLKVIANKGMRVRSGTSNEANYVQLFTSEKTSRETRLPLTVTPLKRTELTADFSLPPGTVGFTLHLIDDDGLTSKDSAVYRVDLTADRSPIVRILVPDRKEVLLTRQSELEMTFTAEDDFGLGGVNLHYRVDEGDEQTVKVPIDAKNKSLRTRYVWPMSDIALPQGKPSLEGSVVEFWLEAVDLNDVTGPLKGETEHYQARIVSKDDKQKELIGRMGEQLTIMRSITERQDETSKDLGTAIEQATTQPTKR